MSEDTSRVCGCTEAGVINSPFVLNNSCSGSFSSVSDYRVWMKAGVGGRRQQDGQEEKDNAIFSVLLAEGDVEWWWLADGR